MSAETENHSAASGDLEHSGMHEAAYLRASSTPYRVLLSSSGSLPDDRIIITGSYKKSRTFVRNMFRENGC